MVRVLLPRRRVLAATGGVLVSPDDRIGHRACPGRLADQAGTLHQSLPGRCHHRRAVAHRLPGTERAHRPAVHRREQEWFGRQCRRRRDRQVDARRLHGRALQHCQPCDLADALRQAAVRCREGFYADQHAVGGAQHLRHQARLSGEHGAGAGGAGEGQSRQVLLRLRRLGHQPASVRRDAEAARRPRHAACALSRRCAGDAGHALRASST